jgi:hypothetical protein
VTFTSLDMLLPGFAEKTRGGRLAGFLTVMPALSMIDAAFSGSSSAVT